MLLRGSSPYPFQRELSLQIFIECFVRREQLFNEFLLRPKPYSEDICRYFLLYIWLETSPRGKESFGGSKLGDGSQQLVDGRTVGRRRT